MGFRPHQGIIEFNIQTTIIALENLSRFCFRPHQGIIEFNPVSETVDIYWF